MVRTTRTNLINMKKKQKLINHIRYCKCELVYLNSPRIAYKNKKPYYFNKQIEVAQSKLSILKTK
jgi:hypothetical protein